MRTLLPFILSIFLPGAGQIVLKEYGKGALMLFISIGLGLIVPFLPIQYLFTGTMIWSLVDLYFKTEKTEGKAKAVKNLIFSLIVVIILIPAVIYLSIISFSIGGDYVKDSIFNSKNTDNELTEISKELDNYFHNHKNYPNDFEEFVRTKPIWENWKTDSWGNKYLYQQQDSLNYKLTSSGKDGKFNTEDDLFIESIKK